MELAGTAWTLVDFETDTGAIPALAEAPATLDFSKEGDTKGMLSGGSGCNRYFANYSLADDHLRIGPLGSTRMFCGPAQMAQEERYFQALAIARSCELSNGVLLIGYTGGTLRFERTTESNT
ncbi:MAG: META domain-containing protein [Ktedonobacteraceae bacterium]